jgi:hypothetical protein
MIWQIEVREPEGWILIDECDTLDEAQFMQSWTMSILGLCDDDVRITNAYADWNDNL